VINYLVQGFRGKTPGDGFFFLLASDRPRAEFANMPIAQPIEKKFNVLKQNKKYYLKYRYFIYVGVVI